MKFKRTTYCFPVEGIEKIFDAKGNIVGLWRRKWVTIAELKKLYPYK